MIFDAFDYFYAEKTIQYSFFLESRWKSSYKIFYVIPSFAIVKNTQTMEIDGEYSWEFYIEWLFYVVGFEITIKK